MGLYKNRKGIVHSLSDKSPQAKKWLKDDQVTRLTPEEEQAYAKSLGIAPKKGKKAVEKKAPAKPTAPVAPVDPDPVGSTGDCETDPGPETNPAEPAEKTPLDLARDKYRETFAEEPNVRWNLKTLENKMKEVAPE